MNHPSPQILLSDNHLIAVNKPAGLATQTKGRGSSSLIEIVREWIREEQQKPGQVYLGLIHPLDRPVAGVVLFARTSKAANRLSRQISEHAVQKVYRACVEGVPENKNSTLIHYLRKEKSRKATVFPRPTLDAKQAELTYHVVQSSPTVSELEVTLNTDRFNQIRAQLSFIGHPVLGDTLYRSRYKLGPGQIALYASQLIFTHPVSAEEITIVCPPPSGWSKHLRA